MAGFLAGLAPIFALLPSAGWGVVHLITALAAFWIAFKLKENSTWMWAYTLYGLTGLLYTGVHFGYVDNGATHYLESVLVFVAFVMLTKTPAIVVPFVQLTFARAYHWIVRLLAVPEPQESA